MDRGAVITGGSAGIGLGVACLPAVNTPRFGWARNRTGHEQNAPDRRGNLDEPVAGPAFGSRASGVPEGKRGGRLQAARA